MNKKKKNFKTSQGLRRRALRKLKSRGIMMVNGRKISRCKNKELFDEILIRFGKPIEEIESVREIRMSRKGFIYIIGNLNYNLVKIGFSKDPEKRLCGIQTGCPFIIDVLKVYEGTQAEEKALHRKYQQYRTNGEWFRLEGKLKQSLRLNK